VFIGYSVKVASNPAIYWALRKKLGDVAKKAQGNLRWRHKTVFCGRDGIGEILPRRAATAKNMHRPRALRLERDEKGKVK
jgi:hypothetical protein